jgi:hypothetical protein
MDEKTFMSFYKNSVINNSKALQRYICGLLENDGKITFEEQRDFLAGNEDALYIEDKKNLRGIIARTTSDKNFAGFYEKFEFVGLYKYSVPFFFEINENSEQESLIELIKQKNITQFDSTKFQPEFILDTELRDAKPMYMIENDKIFIKFVLQKNYFLFDNSEYIDYRYPIVIYIDEQQHILEIRYGKIVNNYDSDFHMKIVRECISWLQQELNLVLFNCEHDDIIEIINKKSNQDVKMYKQMMQMDTGAAAELTASEASDYMLPFIGEIRELIEENEELFNQSEEIKKLLEEYLNDKEVTASYPYIYVKWVKPVESQSYVVKIIFDYINQKYTLLQHLTGICKDLSMRRMNDAIKFLCESDSFVKGEKI